ncbi:MAG: hypothetical protein LBT35_07215 [Tannerella sp.]|jgi:hypothetical protein|nr:hypothetical protein [Tannerella sp.]
MAQRYIKFLRFISRGWKKIFAEEKGDFSIRDHLAAKKYLTNGVCEMTKGVCEMTEGDRSSGQNFQSQTSSFKTQFVMIT